MRVYVVACGLLLCSVLSAETVYPDVSDQVSAKSVSLSTSASKLEVSQAKEVASQQINETSDALNSDPAKITSSNSPSESILNGEQTASENQSTVSPPSPKVTISEASNWPFVMLTLLAMVICILLIAWIVKRFSGITGLGGKDLKIVSAIALGARERIAIVDVKGQQFLIGVTSQNISLLHNFDDAPIATNDSLKPSEFANKLQSILRQPAKPNTEET